jgi:hypothetical protein
MNADDLLNEFIEREKQIKVNPYLTSRVMGKIEQPMERMKISWQIALVAFSIVLVVILGMGLGSLYLTDNKDYATLNINDSQIENFKLYSVTNHE